MKQLLRKNTYKKADIRKVICNDETFNSTINIPTHVDLYDVGSSCQLIRKSEAMHTINDCI